MIAESEEVCVEDLIDEIAMGPFGSNIKTDCFVNSGIPVFNGSNLTGFETNDTALRYVTPEKANSLGNALASRGDIVITHRGTLGQVAMVPYDSKYPRYVISQSQFRIRCNDKVLPKFFVYYFHTREGQWRLLSNKTQTGVPALGRPTSTFRKLSMPLPTFEKQAKIVQVIDTIQKKIKNNSKLNGYLAVQCEAIAERATGENTVLESLCDLVTEKADCSEADFDTYVSTESLLPNKMGRQIASSLPQTGKVTVYQAGDILISNIRPYFKKIWYADQAGTCSGDVLVFRAKQPEWTGYLYSCLRNDSFFDFVMKGAKGTKMPRGDKKQMLTYEVSASPNQLVIGFMASALKHISTANKESEHLAALRDALLPKLMSGEVDVSKVNLTQLNSHLA